MFVNFTLRFIHYKLISYSQSHLFLSFTSRYPHLITNIAIREERGNLKKLLFRNEIIIYNKEYDIRLVASLTKHVFKIWGSTRENLVLLHANNKGADQPAHLISVIDIHSLEIKIA